MTTDVTPPEANEPGTGEVESAAAPVQAEEPVGADAPGTVGPAEPETSAAAEPAATDGAASVAPSEAAASSEDAGSTDTAGAADEPASSEDAGSTDTAGAADEPASSEDAGSTETAGAPEEPASSEDAGPTETAPPTTPEAEELGKAARAGAKPTPAGAKPGKGTRPGRGPRPGGGPRAPRRPGTGGAGAPVPRPPKPGPSPAAPPVHDAQEAAHAAAWGRVDSDGTVWVREAAGERVVGQFPDAEVKEALAFYVVRFLDLQAQVDLLEARLSQLAVKEIDHTLAALEESLTEPAAVGDLDGLRTRLADLKTSADERREQAAAEREAARAQALAARTLIIERVEQIAAADPERTQWRQAGERLRELLDEWKEAQRHGPRIDKASEDALWKRFSHARATFDRGRRQHFAELEQQRAEAKAAKEKLIERAEQLADSTDWGATAGAYRGLMDQWKSAGRAAPREDDALWARFRAAQDAFFAARNAAGNASEEEYAKNLEAKLAVLAEAEALLPIKDLNRARSALRSIQDRWDAIGKVPRAEVQRVEGRLRAVEQAVRDAHSSQWTRRNPEAQARTEGLAAQLEASIAGLEADLDAARANGNERGIEEAEEALSARKAWLAQVRRTASEIG